MFDIKYYLINTTQCKMMLFYSSRKWNKNWTTMAIYILWGDSNERAQLANTLCKFVTKY